MSTTAKWWASAAGGRVIAPAVAGLIGLGAWVFYVDVLGSAPRMLPSPVDVVGEFGKRQELIVEAIKITALNALIGLVVGAIAAILFAAIAAAFTKADAMLAPIVAALAVVPIVAITPILNTMFGASSQFGRQAVAALAAFIPVFVNTLRGLRQTRPVHRDFMRAAGASADQVFRMLTLPSALPFIMTGVRIASSLAVISALVAEYFGGPANGVGTAIATHSKSGHAALAWAHVFGGIAIGLLFFLVTSVLEWRVTRRKPA